MNISLPDTLRDYVEEQVGQRGYGTSSAFVQELIRADRDRQQLRDVLLAGAMSTPTSPVDSVYFDSLRTRVRAVQG